MSVPATKRNDLYHYLNLLAVVMALFALEEYWRMEYHDFQFFLNSAFGPKMQAEYRASWEFWWEGFWFPGFIFTTITIDGLLLINWQVHKQRYRPVVMAFFSLEVFLLLVIVPALIAALF